MTTTPPPKLPDRLLQPVFRLRIIALDPAARTVTCEIQALGIAPIVAVVQIGQLIQYSANIIDPKVETISQEARAAIEAASRRG